MAITNGYCTVAEVREHIDDETLIIAEALIERVIGATSRAIDRYCGFPRRKFWIDTTPTIHEYLVTDTGDVWIDDLGSRTGLVVQTDPDADGSFAVTWGITDYVPEPRNADLAGASFAWTRLRAVGDYKFPYHATRSTLRVTGLHGWSSIPPEVNEACMLKAVSLLKRKDAPFGVAGFGEFGTSVRIKAEDPDVAELLWPLRRYGAGTV